MLPVIVNDERDCFEEYAVLRVGVLNLLRLGRLLRLVQDRLQTLVQTTADTRILGRRVILKQTQQLDGQPEMCYEMKLFIIRQWYLNQVILNQIITVNGYLFNLFKLANTQKLSTVTSYQLWPEPDKK